MKTANGIYLDLKESEYKFEAYGFIFYFSSKKYLEKFKLDLVDYIILESLKIRQKYNIFINLDKYLSISLYKRIEKRGFRIYDLENKKEITKDIVFTTSL